MEIFRKLDVGHSEQYYEKAKGKYVTTYAKFIIQNKTYYLAQMIEYDAEIGGEIKRIGDWYEVSQKEFNE